MIILFYNTRGHIARALCAGGRDRCDSARSRRALGKRTRRARLRRRHLTARATPGVQGSATNHAPPRSRPPLGTRAGRKNDEGRGPSRRRRRGTHRARSWKRGARRSCVEEVVGPPGKKSLLERAGKNGCVVRRDEDERRARKRKRRGVGRRSVTARRSDRARPAPPSSPASRRVP